MPMINAAYGNQLFWDGRASSTFRDPLTNAVILASGGALESQVVGPPLSSGEMAHVGRTWSEVVARIASVKPLALSPSIPTALQSWIAGRTYPQLFAEAFGTSEITPVRIAFAIATYERTLYSNQAPIDSVLAGTATLTALEQQGRTLFNNQANECDDCHSGAVFSNFNTHYTGVRPVTDDLGRFVVTGNANDRGRMRTPSLRNVELRSAFMRNGRFSTLEEVVEFYNRGGDFTAPNRDGRIRPLGLSTQQKAALVAFLKRPLTDPRVRNALPPFDHPTLYTESDRVPQIFGSGVAGAGNIVPKIVAYEPPLLGNPSFTVGVYDGLGGAQAVLVIDTLDRGPGPSIPPTAFFARSAVQLAGANAGNGFGSVSLSIPNTQSLLGRTLFGRWYIIDAAAAGGVASTQAFRMTIFGTPGSPTSVAGASLPATFALEQNYPNPFNPTTNVGFRIADFGFVTLKVFDVLGKEVVTLVHENLQAGSYRATFDATGLANGVYFYRLTTGGVSQAKKMILAK
jgi:cytochrome c peroxidase